MSDKKINGFDQWTMLTTPIQSMEHLDAWTEMFLGITMPSCIVTEWANSSPAHFIYEVYRAVMDGTPLNVMAVAGRDSGKTLALSIIDLLIMIMDSRSVVHCGMTRAQASRAREYLQDFIYKIPELRALVTKENNSSFKMQIGSNEVGIDLIPITKKASQGLHSAALTMDEIGSSLDPSQISAYKDLSGIPGTHKLNGKPAVIVKISSRQSGASLVEKEIESAPKTGTKILTWTSIDSTQKCTPERHGIDDLPMHINTVKGLAYTDEQFSKLHPSDQEGFVRTVDTKINCSKCPLLTFCKGKLRFQTSNSKILRTIDDTISKVNASNSLEWILSQMLSLQPSREGLVYHEFNRDIHVKSFNQMWEILTGNSVSGVVNRDTFINELKKKGATFYCGIDWGFSAPATAVVLAITKKEEIFVVEASGAVRKDDPEWVEYIADVIHPKYDIQMYMPDSENPSGINLLRKRGLPVVQVEKGPGSVKAGINTFKAALRIPGTNNRTRIHFAPDLQEKVGEEYAGMIGEFSLYSKETDAAGNINDDKYMKGNSHFLDACRYVLIYLYGKSQVQSVMTGSDPAKLNQHDPNMLDLLKMGNVNANDNTTEFKGRGRVKDDDDDPGDDGPAGGGGVNFVWT